MDQDKDIVGLRVKYRHNETWTGTVESCVKYLAGPYDTVTYVRVKWDGDSIFDEAYFRADDLIGLSLEECAVAPAPTPFRPMPSTVYVTMRRVLRQDKLAGKEADSVRARRVDEALAWLDGNAEASIDAAAEKLAANPDSTLRTIEQLLSTRVAEYEAAITQLRDVLARHMLYSLHDTGGDALKMVKAVERALTVTRDRNERLASLLNADGTGPWTATDFDVRVTHLLEEKRELDAFLAEMRRLCGASDTATAEAVRSNIERLVLAGKDAEQDKPPASFAAAHVGALLYLHDRAQHGSSMASLLKLSFTWSHAPQGYDYWHRVHLGLGDETAMPSSAVAQLRRWLSYHERRGT